MTGEGQGPEGPERTQVVVVGAGPVGLLLAAELRLGGADVVVLEQRAAPITESRATTVHARTMELLDQRGLLEHFGTPPNDPVGHFGGIPLRLDGLPTPYPGQWKIPQTRIEEVVGRWAAGLGADIRRGHRLTGITARHDRVEAEAVTGDGRTVRLRAAYLVGCDGERSTVRELAGFGFPGRDADREMLRADVAGVGIPDRRFQRLPDGLAIASRRPDGLTRVMVHEFGRAPAGRAGEPEFSEVVKAWSRVTGEDLSGGTPVWLNAFGNASRQASRYRRGRVLLAGDAAHVQMPVGGQALNLGLQDAANLGWKLAAQVRGRAAPGLLDTYHEERRPVGARVLANISAQALLLLGGHDVEAQRQVTAELLGLPTVRARLAGRISGLDVRYPVGPAHHPLVGARLPPTRLLTRDGPSGTARLLRGARGVLLDLAPDAPGHAGLHATARRWAGRVDVVAAAAPAGGDLAGISALLVRPDGWVVWVDDGRLSDAGAALRRWFGDR
ncbi:FAD-dependent monooxygenase [Streptomyces sp. B1866]|uniref:FAD-dependent monooxygenase n=1 Tax=Streptomyces sp. B1866 TaxID=3075431 RepID=UPI00288E673C|nr:FAD-dependent monooxygenase [Streptomyces sp. B1866]MDT3395510.1 FAD-dependent monooxygenase [Streptomyces sp. B1866]